MKNATLALASLLFLHCFEAGARATHENLNSTLWMQTSPEFVVSCHQAFLAARTSIEAALADASWTAAKEQEGEEYETLPPAVIFDVDETVLDNSAFAARLVEKGIPYLPALWADWVNEEAAPPVPGAKAYISFLRSKGIEIFYVTNRELKAPTLRNIKAVLDDAATAETLLCKKERPEWGSDKTPRRALIARSYRILQLVGDNYNDFTELGKLSVKERLVRSKAHQAYWGRKWIVLSNPNYGSWESALYGYDYQLSDEAALLKKRQGLRTR